MYISGFTLLTCILETINGIVCRAVLNKAQGRFFDMMLDKIMHAPINRYFDITPLSRLLKHFSDDLNQMDAGFLHQL